MRDDKIGEVRISAPLWRGATMAQLENISDLLRVASYHFSDDSAKEWRQGREALSMAGDCANALNLDYAALQALYADQSQLVSFGDFVDAVIKSARTANVANQD